MSLTKRILYVDDDRDGSDAVAYWLTKGLGYEVLTAADGKGARELISREFFDLYLLDYCLPDTTATSLCADIISANPNAPIIVYTALDRDVDRSHAIDAGASFYFVKPDELDLVGKQIVKLFASTSAFDPKGSQTPTSIPKQSNSSIRKKASGIL